MSASAVEARRRGKSNVAYTSGKRGVVEGSDRSVSAVLGDATGRLGTAGREGTLTSNEHEVQETPSRTHLWALCFATRGWLSVTVTQHRNLNSVGVGELGRYQGQMTKSVDCDSG